MKRLIKGLVILGLAVGIEVSISTTTAQASRHYVTTPSSLRGTWYRYDQESGYFQKLVISKYKLYYKIHGSSANVINGKKYYASAKTYGMDVRRFNHHGYWVIEEAHTDNDYILKRTTTRRNGHKYAALHDYDPYDYSFSVWTHYKI